jgi:hypothetical protein
VGIFKVESNAWALLQADQWPHFQQDTGTYQRHQTTKPITWNSWTFHRNWIRQNWNPHYCFNIIREATETLLKLQPWGWVQRWARNFCKSFPWNSVLNHSAQLQWIALYSTLPTLLALQDLYVGLHPPDLLFLKMVNVLYIETLNSMTWLISKAEIAQYFTLFI